MAKNMPNRVAGPNGTRGVGLAQTVYVLAVGFFFFAIMGICLGFSQAPRAVGAAVAALILLLLVISWLVFF